MVINGSNREDLHSQHLEILDWERKALNHPSTLNVGFSMKPLQMNMVCSNSSLYVGTEVCRRYIVTTVTYGNVSR